MSIPSSTATGYGIGGGGTGNKIPKGYSQGRLQNFDPQQMQQYASLYKHVMPGSWLERLASGSDEAFAPMEQQAQRDFQGAIGGMASRFSGLGSGARNSSSFQRAGTQAGQDFASKLAMQRYDFQRTALNDLYSMSGQLLGQQPYTNTLMPKGPSRMQQLMGAAAPIAGAAIGSFGGPAGALAGAQIGSQFGKAILG